MTADTLALLGVGFFVGVTIASLFFVWAARGVAHVLGGEE